jgi:hypothetical protein
MGSCTRSKGVGFLILAAFVLVLGATSGAYAADCTDLCGSIVGIECQISAASIAACAGPPPASNPKNGTFSVAETLRIKSDGIITVPKLAGGNNLTLNIAGDFIMDAGGKIVGDAGASPNDSSAIAATIIINANGNFWTWTTGNITLAGGARISSDQQAGSCNGGRGGNITLEAAGDITTANGSVISANGTKCSAGAILIEATKCREGSGEQCIADGNGYYYTPTIRTGCTIDIDGKVLSQSGNTGTGAKQAPGGGPITINAGCNLIVSNTGIVSSRGKDPGADLVHLQGGCNVNVCGLVESTGTGHAVPNSPTNHCYYQQAGFPTPPNPLNPGDDPADPRLDKPKNSTACVEVWTSGDLVIDSVQFTEWTESQGCNGEINADTGGPGGSSGTSWIDLFALGDITIYGDSVAPYAVHANGNAGTNDNGGIVTVKSKGGEVETYGLAIQANALGNGGKGGNVDVEAGGGSSSGDVDFNAASIQAKGANAGGGGQAGGLISARSWNAYVLGTNLTGELNADGGKGKTPFSLGLVTLQGCGTGTTPPTNNDGVNYTGTVTPSPATILANACGGSPPLPKYVTLPICACCLVDNCPPY